MVEDRQKPEEVIFKTAIQLEKQEDRQAYVRDACGDDPRLLADVQALLQYHDSSSFLDGPVLEPNVRLDESPVVEGPGTVIGRYKLLEKIGEGGMAVVYMAEQEQPIRRKVALKIIKLGMDTRQVIARFEAERQALALMDHPSIAKVLDAGSTETGRPYFVMELVTGVSITEYCDKNNLSTKDRLALFVQVCNAVQHAHQKGIIHRDIKPSNVMVTHHDGKPVPKVIDFGIAKATNQRLTEKTLFTRYAHIIGTPAYMSPEQAELSDLDIDTRTDIYSLGVLLYELLTGTTPFSEEELRKAGYIEMQRIIREQEPVKPSTRIRTALRSMGVPPMSTTGVSPVKAGQACPREGGEWPCDAMGKMPMLREVRGDLDWIVMKSLEKDRARRYDTASALAEDVRRHMDHEPVLARSPGTAYRVRKCLRRHRSQVVAALAIAVVAGAVAVVLSMWNRDRQQLAEAEGFKHRNILSQAREQYAKADRETALETIKPILHSKHVGPEAQLLRSGILVDNRRSDEAVTTLTSLLDDQPEIAGAAHALLARILWESESLSADKLKEIEEHRQKAEALLPETAEAYFLRAMTAITIKEQLASLDKALQLDPSHYESRRLRAFTYYASRKYDRLRDDAMAMTILRPRDPLGHSLRAVAFRELGKYQEAIAEYDRAITLTPKEDPQYSDLTIQRSEALLRMGAYERVITEAPLVETRDPAALQYHVFCALTALGEYDKPTALFRQIIAPGHEARRQFQDWCAKYVFDTLEAGRSWHPAEHAPKGAPFLPMVEAEETYRGLSAKGHRVTTDGFGGSWSPDGSKLAFSLGVRGRSGVAVFDSATKETELLIVPGKDPRWSPDGKYIAFVRDRQNLRLEELATAAEGEGQQRPAADEEVWLMNSDGTQPRRLARGGWPSWSQDSTGIYYHSRMDNTLCSISIEAQNAGPKQIMKCRDAYPLVSPDSERVAYLERGSLKVKDVDSQALVGEWLVPSAAGGASGWSPTGRELCVAGHNNSDDRTGLWVYSLDASVPARLLGGQITLASWSADGTKLVFTLASPYFEIWAADLDPAIQTTQALGPSQTLDDYFQEMVAFYTRRIEADPEDAYAYSGRARYHDYLHDHAKATADMSQWSTIMGSDVASDLALAAPRDSMRVIDLPFDCQLVFSAERPVNEIPIVNVAFGQKGRFEMKLFEIPMFVASLLGLGLLAGLDAPPAQAGFTFGKPEKIPWITGNKWIDCFSYDGLEMYVESPGGPAGDQYYWDLWVYKRASKDEDWGPPENLGPLINSFDYEECGASISSDRLTLYFISERPGGYGGSDIYSTTRATRNDPWGPAVNLGPAINSSDYDWTVCISADDLELYFGSKRSGGYGVYDIYVARRVTPNDPWGAAVNLGPVVNTPYGECHVSLSPDGLLLLFSESYASTINARPGGYGNADIWMARRASTDAPWQTPVNLGPLINGPTRDFFPRVSSDGHALYFQSRDREGGGNFQAPILPIVDFDGDGQVGGKELLAMIVQLGGNDPLCDIGPYAWGDGKVGVEDLKVLAGYIGQDVNDPTLIAHWALDEAEGAVVHNSIGATEAMATGDPTWQPADGKVGGALAFDGMDDFVLTQFKLNPTKGPFSVLAWIKGGAPGEVVLSQQGWADWLYTNPIDGSLMTGLIGAGAAAGPGFSDVVITDGQWHRIGLVWDGANRILLVDGKEAARDAQSKLMDHSAMLVLGAGKSTSAASLWSGLIDDVRVYNRAVQP